MSHGYGPLVLMVVYHKLTVGEVQAHQKPMTGLLDMNGNQNYRRCLPPKDPGRVLLDVGRIEIMRFHDVHITSDHGHTVEAFHHRIVIEPLARSKRIQHALNGLRMGGDPRNRTTVAASKLNQSIDILDHFFFWQFSIERRECYNNTLSRLSRARRRSVRVPAPYNSRKQW